MASERRASPPRSRTLLLGLGNPFLGDDGVGLAAAERVAELAGEPLDVEMASVATVDLLPLLAGYERVVVIDAFLSPTARAGTAVHGSPEDLPQGFGYRSLHTLPFRTMLELGRLAGLPVPETISIHGMAVADPWTFTQGFTPEVAAAWEAWASGLAAREFRGGAPEELRS